MSIIGNAVLGGVSDGMRTYSAMSMEQERIDAQVRSRRDELAARLQESRDELLLRLEAMAREGAANRAERDRDRDHAMTLAKEKNKSHFEDRPDLYGAEGPISRARFERSTFTRGEGDASEPVLNKARPLVESTEFDQAAYDKADAQRVQRNINRRVQVDLPQHFDDQQKGRSREIANTVMERDPSGDDAAAAMLTAEGKGRYSMSSGGNAVVDAARGAVETTDIGKSVITKNERPPVRGGGGGGGVSTEGGKDARAMLAGAERLLRDVNSRLNKVVNSAPPLGKEARAERERTIAALRSEVAARQADYEAALRRMPNSNQPVGQSTSAPRAGKDFSKLW